MAQMPEAIILRKTEETKTGVTYCIADVKTNADRIRSMSDEEMASLFGVWVADCDNNDVPCKEHCSYYKSCGDAWLAWLKEEVSGEPVCPKCGSTDVEFVMNLYDVEDVYPDCTVQILRNTVTGEVSVGWWENGQEDE